MAAPGQIQPGAYRPRASGRARAEVRAASVEDLVRHARGSSDVRARAIPLLAERLTDESPRVRAAAAVGLGDLEATDALMQLIVLVEDDDATVRQMAMNALGEIGDARALPRIRRALKDSRPEVRYQAVIAFARIGDAQASDGDTNTSSEVDDVLFEAVSDEDAAVAHIALRVAEERLDGRGRKPDGRLLARARALLRGSDTSSPM